MKVKLSPTYKLENKIELVLILEGVLYLDDEEAVQRCQYITLCHSVTDFVFADNQLLANAFHSIKHSAIFLLDQKNLAKGTLANNF